MQTYSPSHMYEGTYYASLSPRKKNLWVSAALEWWTIFAPFFPFEIINEIKLKRDFNGQHQTMFHHRHQAASNTSNSLYIFKLRENFLLTILHCPDLASLLEWKSLMSLLLLLSVFVWKMTFFVMTSSTQVVVKSITRISNDFAHRWIGNGNSQKRITVQTLGKSWKIELIG